MDELSVSLGMLVQERAIERTIHRYCRGVDRLLPDVVRSCFHEDAVDDHGDTPRGRDELIDWMFGLLATYGSTMHLVGNLLAMARLEEGRLGPRHEVDLDDLVMGQS